MIAPARVAAYKILSAVSSGRADLPTAIAAARADLAGAGINIERDRALASDIATGVQRMRAALDHLITAFSKRNIDRLDPEIVEILRLSAYQLLYHSRVPASAVVDDAVDLARRAGKGSATGFVNAVLRTISRNRASLPLPARPAHGADRAAALEYFSITLSHPLWLASRWYDRLGFDATEAWLTFNNAPAPLTLRANPLRVSREDFVQRLAAEAVVVRPARFAPDGFLVEEGHPLAGAGLDEGWFVVQDEASQLVALLAGTHPGPRVLDACASPGGKDDGDRGGDERYRAARRMRCPQPPRRTAATDRRSERRKPRPDCAGRSPDAAPVRRSRLRLCARRCALLRTGHAPPGSGHPLAPARERSRRRSPRPSSSCWATPRKRSPPADVWSTRPVPASLKRTKRSPIASSKGRRNSPPSMPARPPISPGRSLTDVAICGRSRTSMASKRSSAQYSKENVNAEHAEHAEH